MKQEVNLINLGIELGQKRAGLAESPKYLKGFLPKLEQDGLRLDLKAEISAEFETFCGVHCLNDFSFMDWKPYQLAYSKVSQHLDDRKVLINWGGDHSIAIATVGAYCRHYPEGYVLWIDAHADINLPEHSMSGNFHGMPLAVLLNLTGIRQKYFPWIANSLDSRKLIYLGVRDLDPFEKSILEGLNIHNFTPADIDKFGAAAITAKIQDIIGSNQLHISFDIDGLSPEYAAATGLNVPQGLHLEDVCYIGKALSETCPIKSIDIVEINPFIGKPSQVFNTYLSAIQFLKATLLNNFDYKEESYASIGRSIQTTYAASLSRSISL